MMSSSTFRSRKISAGDIISDIRFEIAQGLAAQDGLGPGIDAVRKFQNKIRAETFEKMKTSDSNREVLSRQFQVIDMLIALLQETAVSLQALQLEIENLREPGGLVYHPAISGDKPATLPPSTGQSVSTAGEAGVIAAFPQAEMPGTARTGSVDLGIRPRAELDHAMRPGAIEVEFLPSPVRLPIVGGLVARFKYLYQRPALFFTNLLAQRQTAVNQVLGMRIAELEQIVLYQQGQIEALLASQVGDDRPQ